MHVGVPQLNDESTSFACVGYGQSQSQGLYVQWDRLSLPRPVALPVFPFLTHIPLIATTAAQMSYQDTSSVGPGVSNCRRHRSSGAANDSISKRETPWLTV